MSNRLPKLVLHCSVVALLIFASHARAQTPDDLPTLSDVERELKGGETHSYRIALTAGQFLHAIVEQDGIDVIALSFAPDGKQLTECDTPNGRWGGESVLLVAAQTGEYRVEVRSPNARVPAARYSIHIVAQRDATPIDKGHAAALVTFAEGAKLRLQQDAASKRAAIEKFQQALPLFRAAGDKYRTAWTLQSL